MNNTEQKVVSVLLADDDKDDRFFFEKALKELPLATTLTTVADGEQLMEYLYKNIGKLPDVLFLDLNMPRKNGGECLIAIKADPVLKVIPTVLCSTSLGDDFANELYKNGAHYYLHKCDFPDLKKCILRTLEMLARYPLQPPRDKFMISLQAV